MSLLLRRVPIVPRVYPRSRSAFPWNVAAEPAAVPLRRVVVNQGAFSRRSNPLFPVRADYKIATPHARRINVLASADLAAVLYQSSGKSDLFSPMSIFIAIVRAPATIKASPTNKELTNDHGNVLTIRQQDSPVS